MSNLILSKIFDPYCGPNVFQQLADYPEPDGEIPISVYKNQIMACTGTTTNCWKYDVLRNAWVSSKPMKFGHYRKPGSCNMNVKQYLIFNENAFEYLITE